MKTGFTIIEIVLSVAVLSIIVGIGSPIYQSFQNRNSFDVATTTIVQTMRHAQVLSQSVDGDTGWGVKIQNGSIVLFQGENFEIRNPEFDEIFDLPINITPSGLSEIIFIKFTGLPQITGSVVLTYNINENRTITINEKGTIIF